MVNHPKLPRSHARNGHLRLNVGTALREVQRPVGKLWLVPYLEANPLTVNELQGRIHRLQVAQGDDVGVLRNRVVALRHIDDVVRDVLLHHKPRPAAET